MLSTLTFGIIEAPSLGLSSPVIVAALSTSAAALLVLLLYEPRRTDPLIELRFFRSIPFTSSIVISVAAFLIFGGFLFLSTLYLQEVRGLSPVQAGLFSVPMAVMVLLISPLAGRLVGRRGPRLSLLMAGASFMIACGLLVNIDSALPLPVLGAAFAVLGVGLGFVNTSITTAAVSGMPRSQAGVAAAVATTSRQVGQTLGVALVGAIVTTTFGNAATAEIAEASHPAWWTLTGCGALVILLGYLGTTPRANSSARRTAAQLNPEALSA
jgi:MFS family permease